METGCLESSCPAGPWGHQPKWSKELQRGVLQRFDTEALNIYQFTPALPHHLTWRPGQRSPTTGWGHRISSSCWPLMACDVKRQRGCGEAGGGAPGWRGSAQARPGPETHQPGTHAEPAAAEESLGAHAADQNAATRLIRYAIGNNEYGEMEPERLSAMLTLPEDLARMYRDDITVTVVYFNSDSIGASSKGS